MSVKIMGSTPLYMTKPEAARTLGVTASMVEVYANKGLLDPHYPNGKRAGQHYLAEDVYALSELRTQHQGDFFRKLPQIAMRAVVTSRRVERKLDELMSFLGMNDVSLGTERDDVLAFHMKVLELMARTDEDLDEKQLPDDVVFWWAQRILALNEEYFELVRMHLLEEKPWELYLGAAQQLVARAKKGTKAHAFMEHARANVRNAAYFYERGAVGPKEAKKAFPGEHYSKRLVERLMPT